MVKNNQHIVFLGHFSKSFFAGKKYATLDVPNLSWKHKILYELFFMVKRGNVFWSKKWVCLVKTDENLQKNENIIKRGSIYDHFYMGGSAWGSTWCSCFFFFFFEKMFEFEKLGPKINQFYEKIYEVGLESTVLDENRWKWSQIT